MARPRNRTPLPAHPAIDPDIQTRRIYNHTSPSAKVTCPECKVVRWYPVSVLRQQLKRHNFNGQCRPCGHRKSRLGYYQWAKRNGVSRREVISTGYIVLGPTAIPAEDLPLFRAMQNRNHAVLEHRWVMAKHLGRPLTTQECVDHMDGNKQHNHVSNLRLYVRGKQQPGSCPGHGTYYHEWQMALREIRRLKAQLKTH
jgi:hypothetical protein